MNVTTRALGAILLSLVVAAPAAAQVLVNRITGKVTNQDDRAFPGVTVTFTLGDEVKTLTTNEKGEWAAMGLSAGAWAIDFTAEGYEPTQRSLQVTASLRTKPLKVQMQIAVPKGPPPEIRQSLEAGDAAYQAGSYAEARAQYAAALALIDQHELQLPAEDRATLYRQIAFCYKEEGNTEKVLEYLDKVLVANPEDPSAKALIAMTVLDAGDLDRAMALLAELEGNVTNPDVFFNVGVQLLNRDKREEAVDYFGKAVAVDPAYVDGYFQRGLTLFGMQKLDEAKADFEKVLELSPEGPQAETARKVIDSLSSGG